MNRQYTDLTYLKLRHKLCDKMSDAMPNSQKPNATKPGRQTPTVYDKMSDAMPNSQKPNETKPGRQTPTVPEPYMTKCLMQCLTAKNLMRQSLEDKHLRYMTKCPMQCLTAKNLM